MMILQMASKLKNKMTTTIATNNTHVLTVTTTKQYKETVSEFASVFFNEGKFEIHIGFDIFQYCHCMMI